MTINSFSGEHSFLSNFHECEFEFGGVVFKTVEHAFQSHKTLDPDQRTLVINSETPGKAKRLGKKVTLRSDWENIKVKLMIDLTFAKFTQNKELHKRLLSTGVLTLIEGNHWHDNFWGNCFCDECKDIVGENNLGKILMFVRSCL
jgi:ribA/ribD-fused uncharacterized protein